MASRICQNESLWKTLYSGLQRKKRHIEADKTKQVKTGLQMDIQLISKVKGGIPYGLGKDDQ